MQSNSPDDRLLGLRQVLGHVPVARSTWFRWVAAGIAPSPVKIGRRTFWRASEIQRLCAEVK